MTIDLDNIRERALPTRDGFYHVVGAYRVMREEDFDALIAEVERLRSTNELLEQEARIRKNLCDGFAEEATAERAAVVAWLLGRADLACDAETERVLVSEARGIERGEHWKETP